MHSLPLPYAIRLFVCFFLCGGDDDYWVLSTPFPVMFYGANYSEIACSTNANLQFSSDPERYTSTTNINQIPSNKMDGAIFAFMTDMRTDVYAADDFYSGMIGVAPQRIFVIDWQGSFYSNDQPVRFQVHFREDSAIISLLYGVGSNFKAPLMDPHDGDAFYVGVQQFGETGPFTRYDGDLSDFLLLNFDPKPAVIFSGLPTQPLLIQRGDVVKLSLSKPADLTLISAVDLTLTCLSPNVATLVIPLHLCPTVEGAELCINATVVDFNASLYSIDVEFVCTTTAAIPSDAYFLPQPFSVSIHLPRLRFHNVPTMVLTVPKSDAAMAPPSGAVLTLVKPEDLELPASITFTLTCTMVSAPTLSFPLTLCAAADDACVDQTDVKFSTSSNMPSGDYVCVSALVTGTNVSSLYSLPGTLTIGVLRPSAGVTMKQSWAIPLSIEGFINHDWFGTWASWTLKLPFPVSVYGVRYEVAGISSNGNLQFTFRYRSSGWSNYDRFWSIPSNDFGTTLSAFTAPLVQTQLHSGVVGEAPNRIFVIDYQGRRYYSSNTNPIRFQYLLYENSSHQAVIYSGAINTTQPWMNHGIAVGMQSKEYRVFSIFDGELTDTTRIDYFNLQLQLSDIPTMPLRAPTGATVTLVQPTDIEITHSTNYILTCTSTTATSLFFPLRLCAAADMDCTPIKVAEFSTTTVTIPVTYTCTSSFVGLPSLVYSLPTAFTVRMLPPLTTTNEWRLTVSGPVGFMTRTFSHTDTSRSPVELPVQAGDRHAVGASATSLTHWMSGSNCRFTRYSPGYIEPNQVASDTNTPSSRAFASSWVGGDGNLYIHSGYDGDQLSSDLWRFTRTTGQWSQLSNPTSSLAVVYGNRGQPSNNTNPGARVQACSSVDDLGDLWLFGTY